jgi:hypothetical protein
MVDFIISMSACGNMVTCLLIGDTGVGKSEFGNRYLGQNVFETSDSPNPVTLEPKVRSAQITGLTRFVIDTEGHADGNSISSEQIQKLSLFLKQWDKGVNGICVILNGQYDRFSQGVKDTLRWAYNTFASLDVLSHICIVFTCCYDAVARPNRQQKQTEYRACVQQFLGEIACTTDIPTIPIFFVDSLDLRSAETERNLVQFHGWLVTRRPLLTKDVRAVALRDKIEDECQSRVFKHHQYSGSSDDQYRYAVYEDRKRQKITPYNGDPVRYSEWVATRTWQESAGHRTTKTCSREHESEEKVVDHHNGHSFSGFSSHNHTHYDIYRSRWTEEWTVTTDFDGYVTQTQPRRVGTPSRRKISEGRERGFTDGYERVIS